MLLLSFVIPFRTASAGQQNPDENRLVVNANYVAVGATVTDTAGKFADGLRAGNFKSWTMASRQPIAYFALDRPTDVLVLIEAGPAVYLIAGGHLRAATALLQGLSPQDRVAVVKYAETPEGISDFNADKRVSAEALERLRFFLGSGALNLSGSMSTVLDWLDKTPARKPSYCSLPEWTLRAPTPPQTYCSAFASETCASWPSRSSAICAPRRPPTKRNRRRTPPS